MLSNLEQHMNHLDRITLDPEVVGGKPCIRGTRVTVGTIVGLIASGTAIHDILRDYPYLEADDIPAALSYAGWRSQELEFPSVPQPHPNLPDDPHQG
jgi:uncharacterized protein (DUF433 family)